MLSQILTIGLTADLVNRGQSGVVSNNHYALAITILILWVILLIIYVVSTPQLVPWFVLVTGFNVIVSSIVISKNGEIIGKDLNNIAVVALIINVIGLVVMMPAYKSFVCKFLKKSKYL